MATLTSLGREVPLGLALCPGCTELDIVVGYRDGLERFAGASGLASVARLELGLETFRLMTRGSSGLVLAGGTSLTVLDLSLTKRCSLPAPDGEPIRALLPLSEEDFLSYSDDESVRHWSLSQDDIPQGGELWPVSCLPLASRPAGKGVICLENGRLCERDRAGKLSKSWPKSKKEVVSAFADPKGHCLVSVDEDGQAQLWDLHSREPLSVFQVPLRIQHGCFRKDGGAGVLLSQDGDLLAFQVANGSVRPLPALETPAVDAVHGPSNEVIALDENGGLWSLETDQPPRPLGGAWAGWATCALCLADGRTVVGTAGGELLLYPADGTSPCVQRAHQDAVLALFPVTDKVLSVSADGQVRSTPLADFAGSRRLADFAGETVIGCHLEADGERLWLALEEGRVVWMDPRDGNQQGELQLPEHRVEELRPGARPGEVMVLTDRGSLKRLSLV